MSTTTENNPSKTEKISNLTDFLLIGLASFAYLISSDYPKISLFMTTFVGLFFIMGCLPHFIMMFRERRVLTYFFIKYIIQVAEAKCYFIVRNTIVYFIYYYVWSFNENTIYLTGLSMAVAFDIVVLINILSNRRVKSLQTRFISMKDPTKIDNES
jgi:hypothetical protein